MIFLWLEKTFYMEKKKNSAGKSGGKNENQQNTKSTTSGEKNTNVGGKAGKMAGGKGLPFCGY